MQLIRQPIRLPIYCQNLGLATSRDPVFQVNNKGLLPGWVVLVVLMLCNPQAMATETGADGGEAETGSLVIERIERERAVQDNRSVLLAHKRNYLLPLTYAWQPNDDVFEAGSADFGAKLDNLEFQFQLSIKATVAEALFTDGDALLVAFTVKSFWQAYNREISAPFRETNYEPEIFWITPVPWEILGGDATLFALGLSHQSNGRSLPFSRSWNRIYGSVIWERRRFVFNFKTWWRIPEDEKDDPLDPEGDDNPDIEDFLGNFEFNVAYRKYDQEVSVMLRNNLDRDSNRGAIQIDWTFPLQRRFRGYVQYFNGYGESLIDYNADIERFGIGILLSDLL
ncbi:MAG: phospholipase A [Gammaproteobacteria bacterium]|nr:phospholipase A [Gammaproteobacteria bacterium]MDH3450014.1 phospholipase A [Gammaproteobacteria bacterium]